jgi:TIR domain
MPPRGLPSEAHPRRAHPETGDSSCWPPSGLDSTAVMSLPGRKGHREVKDVPIMPSPGIFISYRRADTLPYARLLHVELSARFPGTHVFMDLDSIEAGLNFAKVIRGAIRLCPVMVVLIGRQWATLADEDGHRRLDDPDDWVRFEI